MFGEIKKFGNFFKNKVSYLHFLFRICKMNSDTERYCISKVEIPTLWDVSSFHGLSYKQLYKRVVESGDFEPDVHYKKDNGELKVSKNILHLLKRKRKPKSTKGGEKK